MHIELFELTNANGISMSPFVWRARCALLYKGLVWESINKLFSDPREGYLTYPTLKHDHQLICGSWEIAEYLEDRFVDRPRLFANPQSKSLAAFVNHWADKQIMPVMFRCIVVDIHDSAQPEDQEYFKAQMEKILRDTLENSQQRQRAKGNRLKSLLAPARSLFSNQDFFGGDAPLYPDFCLFGLFQWSRLASDYDFLEGDPALSDWLARMDVWLDRQETVQGLRPSA